MGAVFMHLVVFYIDDVDCIAGNAEDIPMLPIVQSASLTV